MCKPVIFHSLVISLQIYNLQQNWQALLKLQTCMFIQVNYFRKHVIKKIDIIDESIKPFNVLNQHQSLKNHPADWNVNYVWSMTFILTCVLDQIFTCCNEYKLPVNVQFKLIGCNVCFPNFFVYM